MGAGAGVIILILVVAAFALAKAGSGGLSLVFAVVAVVVFINTPAGSGVPGGVADFFRTVSTATDPTLNQTGAGGDAPAEG